LFQAGLSRRFLSQKLLTKVRRSCDVWGMLRQIRIRYEHATYHVLSRGHRREAIFRDDRDRQEFLRRLETVCGKTSWSLRA